MDDILLNIAKNPGKHVVEVYANVGSNASRLLNIALPRGVVPVAAASDVGKIDIVYFILRSIFDLLL